MPVDVNAPNDYAEFWDDQPPVWLNKMPSIHITKFVRRQSAESPFSHWTFDDAEMFKRIEKNWERQKPGYRDGVILIPIETDGVYSGMVKLRAGQKLVGEYSARREGEEPRKHTYAVGEKMPAKLCYIVLYRHDVLMEGNEAETDKEWEMVSLNASPTDEEPPIQSGTLIANHFGYSGGTATKMSDSEFVAALKVSGAYWKDKALVAPKQTREEQESVVMELLVKLLTDSCGTGTSIITAALEEAAQHYDNCCDPHAEAELLTLVDRIRGVQE